MGHELLLVFITAGLVRLFPKYQDVDTGSEVSSFPQCILLAP